MSAVASDRELLMALATAMGIDAANDSDAAEAAFDCMGFLAPAEEWDLELVRAIVLALERRREAGELVREFADDVLSYYPPAAADLDDDSRAEVSVNEKNAAFTRITGHPFPDSIETWREPYPLPFGWKWSR